MNRIIAAAATFLVVAAAAPPARAVQLEMMLQGYLTNASGTPYTTPQAAEFKVFQGGTAGTAGSGTLVYDETGTVSPAPSGIFTYLLGSGSPAGAPLSTLTFDTAQPVYIEIAVGGTILLPRLQLTGMPYAAVAGVAESLKPVSLLVTSALVASSGTFTASGSAYSVTTSSGIQVLSGGVNAPFFSGTLYGDGSHVSGVPGTAPIGALMPYAGTAEPVGWIECDGRSLPQSGSASASWGSYNTVALFSAIGTVWGSAGAGQFNIPDLRGIFPRGYNHGKTGSFSDPDAASRVAQYPSGSTGDRVGSYQADQFASHTHNYVHTIGNYADGFGGGGATPGSLVNDVTSPTGGSETRPKNASVLYIIRVQ